MNQIHYNHKQPQPCKPSNSSQASKQDRQETGNNRITTYLQLRCVTEPKFTVLPRRLPGRLIWVL